MREIRFRAWHFHEGWSKDGKPIEAGMEYDFWVSEKGQLTFPEGGWDINSIEEPNSFVLMQYTGLKDKNGKEIYEGDILSFGEKEWVIKVEFLEGMFGAYEPMSAHWQDLAYWVYGAEIDCSVIGNIYENPELLERP